MRPENSIGYPFVQLATVGSTNNYAMGQVQARLAGHGATWFAHEQTAGKGQREKNWVSEPGQNIIMSIIIEPKKLPLFRQFELSAAVALACHDFFSHYALDETKIKWPNDLYWKDRKAGGILIENVLFGNEWKYAVIGIGININQTVFPPEAGKAVSLKQITGRSYNSVLLSRELCSHVDKRWKQLNSSKEGQILSNYELHMYKMDEKVSLKMGEDAFTATIKGVRQNGELLIESGPQRAIPPGQVVWIAG